MLFAVVFAAIGTAVAVSGSYFWSAIWVAYLSLVGLSVDLTIYYWGTDERWQPTTGYSIIVLFFLGVSWIAFKPAPIRFVFISGPGKYRDGTLSQV